MEKRRLSIIRVHQEILRDKTDQSQVLSTNSIFTTFYFETLADAKKFKEILSVFPSNKFKDRTNLHFNLNHINLNLLSEDQYIPNRKRKYKKYNINESESLSRLIMENGKYDPLISITILSDPPCSITDISKYLLSKGIKDVVIAEIEITQNGNEILKYKLNGK